MRHFRDRQNCTCSRALTSATIRERNPGRTMTDFTMSNVGTARRPRLSAGLWILTLSAAAAFVLLSIRYFMPDGASLEGRGALLVVFSTGLLAAAGPLMGLIALPHRLFLL